MRRGGWILLLLVAALGAMALQWSVRKRPTEPEWPAEWRPLVVRGQVLAGGKPVVGAEVRVAGTDPVVTGGEGRFEAPWGDRVSASHGALVATARSSLQGDTVLSLVPAVGVRGRVARVTGEPVGGVGVFVAAAHGSETWRAESAADGTFECAARVPQGRLFDLLVMADDWVPYLERRFRGGDFAVVRAYPGEPVSVGVRDPEGVQLSASLSIDLPRAFDGIRGRLATDGAGYLARVRAAGHLPAQIEVVAHRRSDVILWPARVVELRVVDAVRRRGVPRVMIEVDAHPERGTWYADIVGSAIRQFPLRPTERGGVYEAHLPACPVSVRLTAPGYADTELDLGSDEASKAVRMRPLRRAIGGTLRLRGPRDLLVVVVSEDGQWHRLTQASSEIEVPAATPLQVASIGATAGVWVPKRNLRPLSSGETRTEKLHTAPAVRVEIDVDPPVNGNITLTDIGYEKLKRPQRADLREGKAMFWARPNRDLQIDVSPNANYFPVSFELGTEREDIRWPVRLRPAAGVEYGVRDRGGNAVAFARARIWEPGRGGRLELRGEPRVVSAGADGVVRITGLRAGSAALEIAARGFRVQLFATLSLIEGELIDKGRLVLEPAGSLSGRVIDSDGQPVVGAWMRVLLPEIRRLPLPGGGERDLYDLVSEGHASGATDDQGRFDVPDISPRAPLLACVPTARPDLAPVAVDPAQEIQLTGLARLELVLPGSLEGVYLLMDRGRAVLIAIDPPMSLRPLPVTVPAGKISLFIRLRSRRWAAAELDLKPGEKIRLSPDWRAPVR